MRHSTYFLLASFQLAVAVILAIVPFISATSNLAHTPRGGIHNRDRVIKVPWDELEGSRSSVNLPAGWSSLGCYTDNPEQHALTSTGLTDTLNMTVENCIGFCGSKDKYYAGIENGTDCYCGNVLTVGSKEDESPPNNCTVRCPGNNKQYCGDVNRLSLYSSWTGTEPPPLPTMIQHVGNFTLKGCYSDKNDARTLTTRAYVVGGPSDTTVELCIDACDTAGYYKWVGVELANQCWCGNSTENGGGPIDTNRCVLACSGDSSQICGGSNALTMYHNDF